MKWNNFRQGSRRISVRLAVIPSLAYGVLYLLLIPCFAGIYLLLADDFYHSTSQFEKTMHGDASHLLGELHQVVGENFLKVYKGRVASVDGWTFAFSDVSFHSLKVEEQEISFAVRALFKSDTLGHIEAGVQPRVSIPLGLTYAMWLPGQKEEMTDFKPVQFQQYTPMNIEGLKPLPLSALFPRPPEGVGPDLAVIAMPRSLSNQFVRFARATRGFPSGVSGGYPRMLYLSTVTITTLGYGDIVPLTSISRSLVALEATLGIVLVGLFLNALAHENSTAAPHSWVETDIVAPNTAAPADQKAPLSGR